MEAGDTRILNVYREGPDWSDRAQDAFERSWHGKISALAAVLPPNPTVVIAESDRAIVKYVGGEKYGILVDSQEKAEAVKAYLCRVMGMPL